MPPTYRMGDGFVHIKMTNTRKRPAPAPCCARIVRESVDPLRQVTRKIECRCMAISTRLCDWPLEGGGTCSAPLCPEHTHSIGPDEDLCDLHFAMRERN